MIKTNLDLNANIINVSDMIARLEELEDEQPENEAQKWELCDEYATLVQTMLELKGSGGDEQWRGDWYPATLIRDSHFKDYAQELAEDCGMVDSKDHSTWPNYCIDWDYAARELRYDYSSVDINGVTYWTR